MTIVIWFAGRGSMGVHTWRHLSGWSRPVQLRSARGMDSESRTEDVVDGVHNRHDGGEAPPSDETPPPHH